MTGSWVAVVTPYDEDGSVDYATFEELIDFHAEHGTSGLLVMGSTGESALLSTAERREIIERSARWPTGGSRPLSAGRGRAPRWRSNWVALDRADEITGSRIERSGEALDAPVHPFVLPGFRTVVGGDWC